MVGICVFEKGPDYKYSFTLLKIDNRCNRSEIIPIKLTELIKYFDENLAIKELIKIGPTITFINDKFVIASPSDLYNYIKKLSSGEICSGFGCVIFIASALYIMELLGKIPDPEKMKINDHGFHTANY